MASTNSEIAHDFPPLFRVFKDGRVERLPFHLDPPPLYPKPGVDSKDVVVSSSSGVSARVFFPKIDVDDAPADQKLPLLVHYHGGGFCVGSSFDSVTYNYLTSIVAAANLIAVSVDYRLAPEHPLPAAYDDSWASFQWIASHATGSGPEPLFNDRVDFGRVFVAGESAGANIAQHVAVRAGVTGLGGVKLVGAILVHPFFAANEVDKMIEFLYPSCRRLSDDPRMNPGVDPELKNMGCERVIVFVAEKDWLKSRGTGYCETLGKSGWRGAVELVETEGEDHCFHMFNPTNEKAAILIKRTVSFINQERDFFENVDGDK